MGLDLLLCAASYTHAFNAVALQKYSIDKYDTLASYFKATQIDCVKIRTLYLDLQYIGMIFFF